MSPLSHNTRGGRAAATRTPTSAAQDAANWRALHWFNVYRLIAAGLFTGLAALDYAPRVMGTGNAELFFAVALVHFTFAIVNSLAIHRRWVAYRWSVHVSVAADIAALTGMTYAAGGVASGLGTLLIVSVAGGSLLASTRMSVLYAALASLGLLGQEVYAHLQGIADQPNFTHAGILGLILYATAVLGSWLARRVRESEALAAQRGVDLANLAQLNEYVIQHLQSGVVVVDAGGRVRLMNDAARMLLNIDGPVERRPLREVSADLDQRLAQWRRHPSAEPRPWRSAGAGTELQASFKPLGGGTQAGALIFVEDTSMIALRAQQMKLASLGRLTASIAHEVRNPLGAISHAGQLLAESEHLHDAERRLTEIIREQSQRVNRLVENVLQLSRRGPSQPQALDLPQWLEGFHQEFCAHYGIDPEAVRLLIDADTMTVQMDRTHLHQILWNLCENAYKYGRDPRDGLRLELHAGHGERDGRPYLEVRDHGPGIPAELADQIFEPFFTTESQGTGLGLYIARELCEYNQARLDFVRDAAGGCRFRVTLTPAAPMAGTMTA